jgi:nucleoside-diphosphate-sugar epimerase
VDGSETGGASETNDAPEVSRRAAAEAPRALVIGCGYLGLHIARALSADGFLVTGTTRSPERAGELEAAGLRARLLDLGRGEETASSDVWRERYEAVVYAVAPGRASPPPLAFRDGALLAARLLAPPPSSRFLYVSSTGVYGQADGSEIDEAVRPVPPEGRQWLILEAEAALLELAGKGGPPVVILRLGGLYGPGRSPVDWLRRPGLRERLGSRGSEAWMTWIRVEDAARGIALAARRARAGEVYILADGSPVTRGDFFRAAALEGGLAPLALRPDPADLGKRLSIEKARRELGFAPRFPSYREGLRGL